MIVCIKKKYFRFGPFLVKDSCHYKISVRSKYCCHGKWTRSAKPPSLLHVFHPFSPNHAEFGPFPHNRQIMVSFPFHTLSERVCPEKDIPRYIFFCALPRKCSNWNWIQP